MNRPSDDATPIDPALVLAGVAATAREPMLVLNPDLRVVSANRPFCRAFGVGAGQAEGRPVFEMDGRRWDVPALRALLERLLPDAGHVEDHEIELDFGPLGPRALRLNARAIPRPGRASPMILLAFEGADGRDEADRRPGEAEGQPDPAPEGPGPLATFAIDPAGVVTSWGAGAEEVFGYREEEAVGRPCALLFTPEDRAAGVPDRELRTAAEAGRAADERWLLRKDGRRFLASGLATPTRDASGALVGFAKACRDVTDRRQSQLRGPMLASIVEGSDDAIISETLDGVITSWNRAAARIFGYEAPEIVGRHFSLLMPPDRAEDVGLILDRIRRGERVRHFETRRRTKDGRIIDLSLTVSPILDAAGNVVGASEVARDITDRKRVEEELRRSRERMDLALSSSEFVGIWGWDPAGDLVVADERFAGLFSVDPVRAARGVPIAEFTRSIHPDDLPRIAAAIGRALRDGGEFAEEYRVARPDGPPRWVLARGQSQRDAQGRPSRFAGVVIDITERKQAEEAARALGRQFQELADTAPAIFWMTEPDGSCSFLNRRWYETTGQSEGEGYGLGWTDAILPEDREAAARAFLDADERRSPYGTDFRLRQADGSYRWAFDAGRPRFGPDGSFLGFVGVVIDIEDRKRAEQALAVSRQRLDYAARAANVGFWYCDLPFDDLQWDARVKAHFHLPPDARVTIDTFYDRMHPGDREATRRAIDRAIRDRVPYGIDYRTVDPATGAVRWIRAVGGAGYAPDGSPITFDGLSLDVSKRVRAEQDLRDGEERFRQITNVAPLVLWTATPGGQLDFVGERFAEQTGISWDGEGPVDWASAIHPDDLPNTSRAWAEALEAGRPFEVLQRIWDRGSGRHRWHLTRALPLRDRHGAIARWLGANIDIDDRKRAEEALVEARNQAQDANRMKDEFLTTLSHELRTPLNAIVGWSKILRSGDVDAEDLAEGLAAIERNGHVQSQLIEDLLDISRIASGHLRLDVQRVDLAEVVDAAVAALAPAAAAKGVRVDTATDPLAGPASGDPARLQQVAWNLLSNAIKFTPKGGQVRVQLGRDGSRLEIRVADTGLGIRPEFLPHVFDRFRQADGSTTRRHGGLGVGLSIVKQLVDMHGGSIRAESPGEGLGATFTVALPVGVDAGQAGVPAARPRGFAPGPGDDPCRGGALAGLRVLVVDDEPDARQLLRRVLAGCGAEVTLAGSADEALEALGPARTEVIVSDVGMPGRDGYDLIRRVRATHPADRLPAAALTAFARDEDRRRAIQAGFQAHLAKPFDPAELLAVVAGLAGRSGGHRTP